MSELRLKGTKTRNSTGLVKYKTCFCGRKYQVHRGKNIGKLATVFDPKQCGRHLSMKASQKEKKTRL